MNKVSGGEVIEKMKRKGSRLMEEVYGGASSSLSLPKAMPVPPLSLSPLLHSSLSLHSFC